MMELISQEIPISLELWQWVVWLIAFSIPLAFCAFLIGHRTGSKMSKERTPLLQQDRPLGRAVKSDVIQDLLKRLTAAEKAGDTARAERINARLTALGYKA